MRCKGARALQSLKIVPLQDAGIFAVALSVIGVIGTTGLLFVMLFNEFCYQFWFPQLWWEYFFIWGAGGTVLFGIPKYFYCYRSVRGRRLLRQHIKEFSVKNARVTDPDDRAPVEASIRRWFGTLHEFDRVVQYVLPQIMLSSIGDDWRVAPYHSVLYENAGIFILLFYDTLVLADNPREVAYCILIGFSEHIVLNPLFLYSLVFVARLHRSGWRCAPILVGVFSMAYPAWFAFCMAAPLSVSYTTTFAFSLLVLFLFTRRNVRPD